MDEIQEVYRSQGVSINNKHIEVILRKVAPVNRVKIDEEGDTSFVAGDLVWTDEIDAETAQIEKENEENIAEAVRILSGRKLLDVSSRKGSDVMSEFRGIPLGEEAIRALLKPGMMISSALVEDGDGNSVNLIVGEAAFRKQMEGMDLVASFSSPDGKEIPAGACLPGELGMQPPDPATIGSGTVKPSTNWQMPPAAEDIIADGRSSPKKTPPSPKSRSCREQHTVNYGMAL